MFSNIGTLAENWKYRANFSNIDTTKLVIITSRLPQGLGASGSLSRIPQGYWPNPTGSSRIGTLAGKPGLQDKLFKHRYTAKEKGKREKVTGEEKRQKGKGKGRRGKEHGKREHEKGERDKGKVKRGKRKGQGERDKGKGTL